MLAIMAKLDPALLKISNRDQIKCRGDQFYNPYVARHRRMEGAMRLHKPARQYTKCGALRTRAIKRLWLIGWQ